MENNNNTTDQFDALLFGHLQADEQQQLEQKIASDSQLGEAFRQHKAEIRAMQILHEDDLRKQMNSWSEEAAQTTEVATPKVSFINTRFFRLAAAACGLLLVGYFAWWSTKSSFDAGQFAATNYPKSLNETIVRSTDRGATDPMLDPFSLAIKAIEKNDYAVALVLLDQVNTAHPQYSQIPLLKGDCEYHLQQFDRALTIFRAFQKSGPTQDLREMAEWRTVIVLLAMKQNKSTELKELLTKITANPDHLFVKEAKDLKAKM